jgi:GntR family histidine utilization transcriptional repressor
MSIAGQIRADVTMRILSGEWRPGFRIPFEHELVAQYGCARGTVSKALAGLAASGLVERRRKAGSFVAHPHLHSAALDIPDIGVEIAERTGHYRFAGRDVAPLPRDLAAADFPANAALRAITGVHWGDAAPFACEARLINLEAVPAARAPDFADEPPGAWLLHHVPWSEARHRISAVGADGAAAKLLAVRRQTPCLQVERWTWSGGAPVTYVRQTFLGDRYDLIATFAPQGR